MMTQLHKHNIAPPIVGRNLSAISQRTEFFLLSLFSVRELTALDLSVNDTEITAQGNDSDNSEEQGCGGEEATGAQSYELMP